MTLRRRAHDGHSHGHDHSHPQPKPDHGHAQVHAASNPGIKANSDPPVPKHAIVHSKAAPAHPHAAPVHSQAAPAHSQAAPAHSQAAPVHNQAAPAPTQPQISQKTIYVTQKPTFSGSVYGYKTLAPVLGAPIGGSSQAPPPPSSVYAVPSASSVDYTSQVQHTAVTSRPHSFHTSASHLHSSHALVKGTALTSAGLQVASTSLHFTSPSDVAASSPSPSASSSTSPSSSGMSTGGKVGLAVGIIAAIGLIAALIFFLYRRHQDDDGREKLDDEKSHITAPLQPPAPAIPRVNVRTDGVSAGPPRLSMRPLTDLFPASNEKPQPQAPTTSGGLLAPSAALAANTRSMPPVGQASNNSYEMQNRDNANDPTNPFGNHAEAANGLPMPIAAAAGSLSPKPLSIKSSNSGRSSPEPFRNPPSRTASPAMGAAGFAGAGPRPGHGSRAPPPGPNNVHRVQLDFKPSMEDELELHAGQVVRMLHEYDDGWALCIRLDRSQQGVVPRTCISKHPVRPRPPPPGMRPQGPPRAMSPANSNYSGRSSPAMDGRRPMRPPPPGGRVRSYSNSPRMGGPPRSMSPGPMSDQYYQGPMENRRRSNSASAAGLPRRGSPPQQGPMNPAAFSPQSGGPPMRKPVAGQAI